MDFVTLFLIFLMPSVSMAQSNCTLAQDFRIYSQNSSESKELFTNTQDGISALCLGTTFDGQMTKVQVNGIIGWVFTLGVTDEANFQQLFSDSNSEDSIPSSNDAADTTMGASDSETTDELFSENQTVSDSGDNDELGRNTPSENIPTPRFKPQTVTPRFKPQTVTPRFKPQLPLIPSETQIDPVAQSKDLVYDKCFTKHLLKSTKQNVRRNHNHFNSYGYCGRAVAQSIRKAGIKIQTGNGVDYYRPPGRGRPSGLLERSGFTNYYQAIADKIRAQGKTVTQKRLIRNAPPGAVLVFKGPMSSSYWRTGVYGEPPGDYVGHVTIKGNDGLFYTDGKTRRAAIKNRQLVGIYLMKDCSHCSEKVRQKSEAACEK